MQTRTAKEKYLSFDDLVKMLSEEISKLLKKTNSEENDSKTNEPYVIMVVGVNGVGKTTTIGKLAYQFGVQGKKIVIGAADTFRAGAIDQLQIWADRANAPLIKQEMGSDPASVAFDTIQSAKSKEADYVLIDTAGRLHNKVNLMNELSKVKRVMSKVIPEAVSYTHLTLPTTRHV